MRTSIFYAAYGQTNHRIRNQLEVPRVFDIIQQLGNADARRFGTFSTWELAVQSLLQNLSQVSSWCVERGQGFLQEPIGEIAPAKID